MTPQERQIAIEILELENELKRRQKENKLDYYNKTKVHKKQMEFHMCDKRNRWSFGGNRTGKTECGAVEAVWHARGNHPYKNIKRPTFGWVVSVSNEVQREVVQKKIFSYLNPKWIKNIQMRTGQKDNPENGVIDFVEIESIHGGVSVIGFKSCEQGRAKFQGAELNWIWFDEEPPKDIYDECKMRLMNTKGSIWGTMTPLMGMTWVYDTIYTNSGDDPQVWWTSMSWEDNPYLDQEEIQNFIKSMSEDEKRMRQFGMFVSLTGLVYKEFNPSIHIIDDDYPIPIEWYDKISIDPGSNNPTSVHWYATDGDGNVYVIEEHYKAGESLEYHSKIIHEKSDMLGWKKDQQGNLYSLIDSAAVSRALGQEKSVVQIFHEHKIVCNPSVNKSKYVGIERVKQYLTPRPTRENPEILMPKLFIKRRCRMMINEFGRYAYEADSNEPKKINDHAMDELRYFIMNRPESYQQPKAEMSLIQKHKASLSKPNRKRDRVYNILMEEAQ